MKAEATSNGVSVTAGHGDKSRLHERAIAALLTAPNVAGAAKAAGVSRATLLRWLQEPGFKAAFRSARREVVEATIGRLQQVSAEAVETLQAALKCKVPTVRVSAARTVLEYSLRAVELMDLEDRIAQLEHQFRKDGEA
jgi:hypothetical protein